MLKYEMSISLLKLGSGYLAVRKVSDACLVILIDTIRPSSFSEVIVGQCGMKAVLKGTLGRPGQKLQGILRSLWLGLAKATQKRVKYSFLLFLTQMNVEPSPVLFSPFTEYRASRRYMTFLKGLKGY
jgi:hypothetical protein